MTESNIETLTRHATIEFYRKEVYGKTNFYIKDSELSDIIRTLTGTITVSIQDLKALRALGFQVVERISPQKIDFLSI